MNRMKQLEGRKIIVTGAASGMGYAVAELFAAHGARIGLLDRDVDGLERVGRATGQVAIPCDLKEEASIIGAVDRSARELGGIDGIVNAAGIFRELSFEKTDSVMFDEVLATNLRGPFLLCRHALPHLREAPSATIVNIASDAAVSNFVHQSAYAPSKAGLVSLSVVMAKELGPTIRVNAILPGIIDTPMTAFLFAEGGVGWQVVQEQVALQRAGKASEIAEACLFLSSDTASFVSGAWFRVNGAFVSS